MRTGSHQEIVSNQFGQRAEAYLQSAVHAQGEDLEELARIVGTYTQAQVLDLGCGGGHAAYRVAPLVARVVAYDLSTDMLAVVAAEAKRRELHNIMTRQGSAEALPFADQTFGVVVTRYSAHHWHDFTGALREARRVLKPNGLAVFMDAVSPGRPLLDTWLQTLELLRDPSHVHNRSVQEWQAAVTEAGFRPGHLARFKVHLDFAAWVSRMKTPETQIAAIRSLQSCAAKEVADYFGFESDGSFMLDTMLLVSNPV
jgi:ubiquinone/menaquinone biosynthesis C-methylase UbiE